MEYPNHLQKFISPNFNLRNYDGTIDLDLVGWFRNLDARKWDYLTVNGSSERGMDLVNRLHVFSGRNMSPLKVYSNEKLNIVEDISCAYALGMQYTLMQNTKVKNIAEGYYDCNDDTNIYWQALKELESLPAKEYLLKEPCTPDLVPINIDLDYSEKQIIEAFSQWLKEAKLEQGRSIPKRNKEPAMKEFTPSELGRWREANVLAYLDLVIWNKAMGQSPTHQEIADILGVSENDIKQKIMPKSLKLIERKTLKRLKLEAIKSMQEEK